MKPRIILTGGGSAGHVTPNIALIDPLLKAGWQIDYIGSAPSIEQDLIKPLNIPFHAIRSGKLRRYFSWKNAMDPFNVLWGIVQSYVLLGKLKPHVIFSKGGFVTFPVVLAAWLRCIPIVAHESDRTPGLANRLCFPFASTICLTFEPSYAAFKTSPKTQVTGTPLRAELFKGSAQKGLDFCHFDHTLPCLLVMGGSLGSDVINACIRENLPTLTKHFQIIHLCGKGKVNKTLSKTRHYCQLEYAHDELADLLAASSIVISRAGANSLYELLALKKLHVLIPLSKKASRGDQIDNARYFKEQGISVVIDEENLSPETLNKALDDVEKQKETILSHIEALNLNQASEKIVSILGGYK